MTDKLYIIGNGFDLHHRLKTRYQDFEEFVKENNQPLYYLLESHFAYPKGDKSLWARFEENLANLDVENVMSDNSDLMPDIVSDDFHSSDMDKLPDRMREIVEMLTDRLLDDFKEFIREVEIPESVVEKKLRIELNACFLTFNYTDTLEEVYGINRNQIVYIHNSAKDFDKIILGHGINPEEFKEKIPNPPADWPKEKHEEWYDQHMDTYYPTAEGKENLMEYFGRSFKPTAEIIQRNDSLFEMLDGVKEVWVLGHSLSGVDIPYFEEVKKNVSNSAKWCVSYYDEREEQRHLHTLLKLGIKKKDIKFFPLEELQLSHKQKG